jgi:hypothetical protein
MLRGMLRIMRLKHLPPKVFKYYYQRLSYPKHTPAFRYTFWNLREVVEMVIKLGSIDVISKEVITL